MGGLLSTLFASFATWIRPTSSRRGPRAPANSGNLFRVPGSLPTHGYDQEDSVTLDIRRHNRAQLEWAFNTFDTDNSGTICRSELRDVLRALGHNPSEDQVNDLMARADENGSGALDMEEFLKFCDSHFRTFDPESDLFPVFRLLDSRGVGLIQVKHVKDLMAEYPWNKTTRWDLEELFSGKDENESLDFDQFIHLITGVSF
ncbi:hypothetical protein TCAL_05346 [Tigriopus californicus]|uniref:EF-hand domain-containing protein n=1 Tax=Tigriopus californicus TaxID=6832 RepID=A0A553PFM2_TIGCA|nr:uncharacterized protein LOC131880049 [Tigriopus californicus]TRY76469.1 hypothetical protein TCAL_05346 [Tigriopus californicus]|eukprot:TCALIF_05346-PA protein Name:"Similar to Caltractin (Chlamydomonas reinhardtii)" AED:0.12 eAED:0.12 QI:70/1/0.75/1/1/1/4/85/201